jgi:hypothetical protein
MHVLGQVGEISKDRTKLGLRVFGKIKKAGPARVGVVEKSTGNV